jgi:hypothetical protein
MINIENNIFNNIYKKYTTVCIFFIVEQNLKYPGESSIIEGEFSRTLEILFDTKKNAYCTNNKK